MSILHPATGVEMRRRGFLVSCGAFISGCIHEGDRHNPAGTVAAVSINESKIEGREVLAHDDDRIKDIGTLQNVVRLAQAEDVSPTPSLINKRRK